MYILLPSADSLYPIASASFSSSFLSSKFAVCIDSSVVKFMSVIFE